MIDRWFCFQDITMLTTLHAYLYIYAALKHDKITIISPREKVVNVNIMPNVFMHHARTRIFIILRLIYTF